MSGHSGARSDSLGLWIRGWDLLISALLLVGAYLMVRLDAVVQLRALATEKAYFEGKPLLLDAYRWGYSYDTVRDHLRALGEEGRSFYAHDFMSVYDLALSLFLLTFSILFVLYATQTANLSALGMPGWIRKVLLIPPVLQFAFDVVENRLLRMLIEEYPRLSTKVVEQAAQMTQLKWSMIFLNALILLGLGGYTVYQWISPPKPAA